MGKFSGLVICYISLLVTTLHAMDDDYATKEQFDVLFFSMQKKEHIPPPSDLLHHNIVVRYKKLQKQLRDPSAVTLTISSIPSGGAQKPVSQSFAHIKRTAEDLIKFQKSEQMFEVAKQIAEVKNTLPSMKEQLRNLCFTPVTLLLLDAQKKTKENNIDPNVERNQQKITSLKDVIIMTAAAAVMSLLIARFKDKAYEWKLLHEEKTDEELRQDFEDVMQHDAKYSKKMKELRIKRVAERLIDWDQEIYLSLFERIFYYANDAIVKEYIQRYDLYRKLMDRAIITLNTKVIKRLLKPDLYNLVKTIFAIQSCCWKKYETIYATRKIELIYSTKKREWVYKLNRDNKGSKIKYFDCPHFSCSTSGIPLVILAILRHEKHADALCLDQIFYPMEHNNLLTELLRYNGRVNEVRQCEDGRYFYHGGITLVQYKHGLHAHREYYEELYFPDPGHYDYRTKASYRWKQGRYFYDDRWYLHNDGRYLYDNGIEIDNGSLMLHPKRNNDVIIRHIKHIIPNITDISQLNEYLFRLNDMNSTVNDDSWCGYYQSMQAICLSYGVNPNLKFKTNDDERPKYCSSSMALIRILLMLKYTYCKNVNTTEFIISRVNGLKLLISYGANLLDNFFKNVQNEGKEDFLKKRLQENNKGFTSEELEIASTIFDRVKKINDEEEIFRSKFFNYNDVQEKNYDDLFAQLNERCSQSAGWWILRVLKIRLGMYNKNLSKEQRQAITIDPTLHDVQKIPDFCLQEINKILSSRWRPHQGAQQDIDEGIITLDQETKRALLQWKKLFCFLHRRLPDAFSREKQKILGKLMLDIVEQGYYAKPKTYESLCPIIEHCLELAILPDITVQGDVEGSILHVLAMSLETPKKNIEMLQKIVETYTLRDPFTLFCALASNIKRHNFKEKPSKPKQVIENRLREYEKEWCEVVGELKKLNLSEEAKIENKAVLVSIEKNIALTNKMKEIMPDITVMKQRAIAHCPYV